jgi:hypothetical protein
MIEAAMAVKPAPPSDYTRQRFSLISGSLL